jgi:hypothetical protein
MPDPDGVPRPLLDPDALNVHRVALDLLAAEDSQHEGALNALLAEDHDWPEVAWELASEHVGLITDLRQRGHTCVPPTALFVEHYRAAVAQDVVLGDLERELDADR